MSSATNKATKRATAAGRTSQHIVAENGHWIIRPGRSKRASSTHASQEEAIETALKNAKAQGGDIVLHSRDGRIRQKISQSPVDALMLKIWKDVYEEGSKATAT
jgi:hypothetical protein